jgi:quinol monooxygenase YgiN
LALSKVILQGYIIVPHDDLNRVITALDRHKALTRQEPGCLVFKVTQDSQNRYKFDVYEEFLDQAAFEEHQSRVKISAWGDVTVNVKRYYQISH